MRRSEKNSSGAGEERLLLEGARPTDRVELASRTEEVVPATPGSSQKLLLAPAPPDRPPPKFGLAVAAAEPGAPGCRAADAVPTIANSRRSLESNRTAVNPRR